MYPDSRTKGRGHIGAWIKGFGRRGGGGEEEKEEEEEDKGQR